jgi:8-oxo-dGTP diphosphatase
LAAVRDNKGWLLLVRRADTGHWELPGGLVELGKSAVAAVRREVTEESCAQIRATELRGAYIDPGHVKC